MKVLVTGGTGLIGKELGKWLVQNGHEVFLVTRSAKKAKSTVAFPAEFIEGDLESSAIEHPIFEDVEAVIHLMGETVSEFPWSKSKKKRILDSRVFGTRNLIESFNKAQLKSKKLALKRVISASAIGYYGDRADENLNEESRPGESFLAEVCQKWESEADSFLKLIPDMFLAKARIGIVLSEKGGAFQKIQTPFWFGLGNALGSGRQWMSWIHLDDVVSYLGWLLSSAKKPGAYNLVSPQPVTNYDFSKELAKNMGAFMAPAVPKFLLKTLLGEFSAIVLASQKCFPAKALDQGFKFKYPELPAAMKALCSFFKNGQAYLDQEQYFDLPLEKVFPFFSEARNLEQITPPFLNFKIDRVSTPDVQKGTLIDYKLKIHGVPVSWRTLIETWDPPYRFVDTQLKGPYRLWHHTHVFTRLGNGTLMKDEVRFKVPLGRIGYAVAGWWVLKDVSKIFSYRRQICDQIFKT